MAQILISFCIMSQCQMRGMKGFSVGSFTSFLVYVGTKGQDSLCQPLPKWSTVLLNNTPTGMRLSLLGFKKIKRGNKDRSFLDVLTGPEEQSHEEFKCLFHGREDLPCLFSHEERSATKKYCDETCTV